jgi:hypothetical protein
MNPIIDMHMLKAMFIASDQLRSTFPGFICKNPQLGWLGKELE